MPELERENTTIHYRCTGQGQPLLLTHGFAATHRMWAEQEVELASTHRVISWDMRGHGRSISTSDSCVYSEASTVADMVALLDSLGHAKAVVGGHSLGGYMSLSLYRAHPERVRALILIDTGPGYRSDDAREKWNRMARGMGDRLESHGLDSLTELSQEMNPGDHSSEKALARAARGMLTQRDSSIIDSLAEIDVPTLLIVGERDKEYLDPTDYMAKKIPGARKVIIPKAGHAPNLHQPDLFNRALKEFLADLNKV